MVFFEDLWDDQGVNEVVNDLALEFREAHKLPGIYQLGLVVPDVEEAAGGLEAQGVGPFFIAHGAPVFWRERGEERDIRGKLGLAHHQGFELELLEPVQGSDFYAPQEKTVVHHLGFLVQDVDQWSDKLSANGSPLWVRGRLKMGPIDVNFAYMDTVEEAGLVIEFISWRVFGRASRPPAGLLKAVGRLEKWTRKRSIPV
ncbi:MAG: VOC family protein [Anaerolineae bacterium]|jgi:hypothetical protein